MEVIVDNSTDFCIFVILFRLSEAMLIYLIIHTANIVANM